MGLLSRAAYRRLLGSYPAFFNLNSPPPPFEHTLNPKLQPPTHTHTHVHSNAAEVEKFYCYCSDACIEVGDPVLNPEGRVVFILDVGEFGVKNFDLMGAKTICSMMSVSGGWRWVGFGGGPCKQGVGGSGAVEYPRRRGLQPPYHHNS